MTRRVYTAGQRVRLPGGGSATVIAPSDAAGLVLVELRDRTLIPVPAEHLVDRCPDDELFARGALRPRTGNVQPLGAVSRERVDHHPQGSGRLGDASQRPSSPQDTRRATDGQTVSAPTPLEAA